MYRRLASADCKNFYDHEFKKQRNMSQKFNESHDSLVKFCFQKNEAGNFKTFLFIVKIIINLSYGQASTKKKFSITNKAPDHNMK